MDTREFVDLMELARRAPDPDAAFAALWRVAEPLIDSELRRVTTLGPFARLEHERDECKQAVAVKLLEDWPRFVDYWRARLAQGLEPVAFEPWLRVVVRRKAIDWARKQPGSSRRKSSKPASESAKEPARAKEYEYEPRFEKRELEELRAGGDHQLDAMMMRERTHEMLTWARTHLPEDERLALHEYLISNQPQSPATRRALEKLRRRFRPA